MLYVPREIRRFAETWLFQNKRNASLGGLYIEIVSKWAWENGFTCSHERKKIHSPPVTVEGQKRLVYRCQDCGMILREGALMRDGSRSLESLGYSIVGFVGGR